MVSLTHIFPAIQSLQQARAVAVITGAGISVESGIPTFRGPDGTWSHFNLEDLATPEGFESDPKLVWEWYTWRRNRYKHARPNPAHYTLVEMERHYSEFLLITQNVDTLHTQAGSQKLFELHGNIAKARCTRCDKVFDNPHITLPENLVRCPRCDSLARPHIVWFGEAYEPWMLDRIGEFLAKTDVVIVVGTSGTVSTPVYLTLHAIRHGAYSIDVNPNESEVSRHVHCHLPAKAGIVLPDLWDKVKGG
ncbi:NAD-dependent deacylase [candidate division KSB3 bacterium]|uniref:NAD-dependent protein deacylase n=1 Tax=candidate division KSB3 bacterium TaxID=2044937 RepID=A0A2G6KFY8_9BACT|nr:MAG: NAD-dependent deacylase [candidate division KSB3 bacterium]